MTSEPQTTNTLAPTAAFAGCCLIWGSTFLVISIGNDSVPPLWAATLRLALASVMLVALTRLTGQRLPRGPALKAAAWFGFLNLGVSFACLYWGEKFLPSGLAAVLYGTVPLTTALLARAVGLEPLRALKIAGALVALFGVGVIFSDQLRTKVALLPLLALFAAPTFGSVAGVVLKLGPRQHPFGTNAVGSMVGFVVCGLASLVAREPHPLPADLRAIVPIVYLAVAGSVGAYVLYTWLVHHWDLSRVSFIAVVVPVVAVMVGALVRHERLTAAEISGSLLVIAGLVLGIASDRRPAAASAPALAGARES
jgi:drug/metabolite transporter (DMT)-like permease